MQEVKQIIEGCIRGERNAQDALYKKFSSLLFGICMRYAGNRMEAQDVLQEVFV
jgi:DNA-directed RNA polymerase specialized sigma24 family protein